MTKVLFGCCHPLSCAAMLLRPWPGRMLLSTHLSSMSECDGRYRRDLPLFSACLCRSSSHVGSVRKIPIGTLTSDHLMLFRKHWPGRQMILLRQIMLQDWSGSRMQHVLMCCSSDMRTTTVPLPPWRCLWLRLLCAFVACAGIVDVVCITNPCVC